MVYDAGCNLKIGTNDKKKEIYIPRNSFFLNTLVLGNKGSGKSSLILKELAYQTISDRNVGGTFIVSSKDLSFELYILAKHYKRRIVFINPSVSNDVDVLLKKDSFSKDDIFSKFDFKKYIFNNYIVIIDLENISNGSKGIKFTSFLIEDLKNAIHKTEITCSRPHFLYVDDAFNYLDYLEDIIYYGNEYNVATTLFFQNREQFKNSKKDYTSFIDSNLGNTILTNDLNITDAKYYGEILDINLAVCSKGRGKIFYELINKDGARFSGSGEVKESPEFEEIVYSELYPVKRALKRKKIKQQKELELSDNTTKEKVEKTNKELRDNKNITNKLYNSFNDNTEKTIDIIEKEAGLEELSNTKSIENFNFKVEEIQDNEDKKNINIFDDGKIELTIDWDDDDF